MYQIYCDGSCTPNPGIGRCAFIVIDKKGNTLTKAVIDLGESTNNLAEYAGVERSLKALSTLLQNTKSETVAVFSDSMLVIQQIKANWAVKGSSLKSARERVYKECAKFKKVVFTFIEGEANLAHSLFATGTAPSNIE